jgi:hypothetical protein
MPKGYGYPDGRKPKVQKPPTASNMRDALKETTTTLLNARAEAERANKKVNKLTGLKDRLTKGLKVTKAASVRKPKPPPKGSKPPFRGLASAATLKRTSSPPPKSSKPKAKKKSTKTKKSY